MQLSSVNNGTQIEVSDAIFNCELNEGLVHQLVTAYMAAGRQGSKAQLTRAEVRGGGKKPWKQKGSGQARAGTTRGPLWRKGGVTFAAKPRDFAQKINKKMYRKGISVILSELVRQDRFLVINGIDLPAPKTKALSAILEKMNLKDALIVDVCENQNLYLSARNIPNIAVCDYKEVNPVNLLAYQKVLFTSDALKQFEKQMTESK